LPLVATELCLPRFRPEAGSCVTPIGD
jgi:hypothetical protein